MSAGLAHEIRNPIGAMRLQAENALAKNVVEVNVTATIENEQLKIAVEDSGSGVPDELKEKIFEPFVSSRSNGTGLGLAIARQIVEAHRGTLYCINGRIGTRLEIRLPRCELCHPLSSTRSNLLT